MRLVTKTNLAAKYRRCERTIDRWIAGGVDLGRIKVGGSVFFDEDKADAAFLAASKTLSSPVATGEVAERSDDGGGKSAPSTSPLRPRLCLVHLPRQNGGGKEAHDDNAG